MIRSEATSSSEFFRCSLVYSNLTWKGFGIDRWLSRQNDEKRARMRAELWSRIESGVIDLPIDSQFELADFSKALERAINGSPNGKVLLR